MNKKWKQVWLKALRSKKFRQGAYKLKSTDNSYCCLGVLRHCIDPESKKSASNRGTYLNRTHLKYVGLENKQQKELAQFNDDEEWSFKRIANWIEKNL